jgi:hypothetical protein
MARRQTPPPTPAACCGRCVFFDNRPSSIEAAFPGLSALSSGYASVRAQDGLCRKHDRYCPFNDLCPDFELAAADPARSEESQ